MEKVKIPTLVGIVFLTISLSAAIVLIKQRQIFRLGAQQKYPPQNVKTTNITSSSFTVIWSTQQQTTGFVQWGESKNNLDKTSSSEMKNKSYLHSSTVNELQPNKTYYFKINSDGNLYGNSQEPWEVKTAPPVTSDSPSGNFKISGKVITASGKEASNIIVIAEIEGASPLSTTTSENGNWIISADTVPNSNIDRYLELSPNTKVSILAQAGPQGISTAEFYLSDEQTVLPPIILGQNHNFTDLPQAQEKTSPISEIKAPQIISKKPRFNTEKISENKSGIEEISIESIDEGETIYTTRPEFFGKAPPQKEIIIKIESESPISETIKTSQNGTWRWSPPIEIAPGNHKITITYRDNNGVLKSIVKNFSVQAAETKEPAFESTPSGTLKPTPTITPTPINTSPQTKSSPSATPVQPVSGVKTPTLILILTSILLFAISGFLLFTN